MDSYSYVSEYSSNEYGDNIFKLNTANRSLGFRIDPPSHMNTDLLVRITYVEAGNTVQVVGTLESLNVEASPPPTPGGDCDYVSGNGRFCTDEK